MRLDERWAPLTLQDVVGQDLLDVEIWLNDRDSRCWLFVGSQGTGKTSTAWTIIRHLDCDPTFGVAYVPCNDAKKEDIESAIRACHQIPLKGYWWVLFFEEMQRLSPQTMVMLKSALDQMNRPARMIVVACSNDTDKIDPALLERFDVVEFHSDVHFRDACEERLARIWKEEYPELPIPEDADRWDERNGAFSMRAAIRDMERYALRQLQRREVSSA